MGNDLRKAFRFITENYGEPAILYRMCSCTPEGQYALQNCAECHGTGFNKTAERYKVRRMLIIPADQAASYQQEGVVQRDNQWVWFAHHVNPSPGDMVVFEDPSAVVGKVLYRIVDCMPLRGRKGRIEYWRTGVRRESAK